jgi:hypothetical protein
VLLFFISRARAHSQVAHHEKQAVAIQRAARGRLARHRVTTLCATRTALACASALEQATVWAQRRARAAASRRRFRCATLAIAAQRLQQRTHAALREQAVARGRAGRRLEREWKTLRHQARSARSAGAGSQGTATATGGVFLFFCVVLTLFVLIFIYVRR